MQNSIIINTTDTLSRPIQLIDGKSYFATNLQIKTEKSAKRAWVVSDGTFCNRYSEIELEGHEPFSRAPFQIALSGTPRPDSTLSATSYYNNVINKVPFTPADVVFRRVSDAIDGFVAFDGSFASQKNMSDFMACWAISTYATDVFDTVGYVWPNGERGSGKSQCLKALIGVSFMGQTITASSSFASVRDEASLGATLGFDDCENIKGTEPNKRELLLAGNTKGVGFMHKVPATREGSWDTKYIDCFAPRAFTSIGLPDDVLASRSIIVPLMRTADVAKTRRKPSNPRDWTTPSAQLRDDIWLNVAADLAVIAELRDQVNDSSDLSGRDFDVFQPTLTIALWLQETKGVSNLFSEMLSVMDAYQKVRHQNHLPSLEHAVLQALWDKIADDQKDRIVVPTQAIANEVRSVLNRWDITDPELSTADVQKIGIILSRIGFTKSSTHGKNRSWEISRTVVEEKARLAGVTLETFERGTTPAESSERALLPSPSGWPSVGDVSQKAPW